MWHGCPALSDPDATGHLQQPPGSIPRPQFPAEGLCPWPGTAVPRGECWAYLPAQSRGGTKQLPFCSWKRARKGCDGKMLVMLISCDNSIKWNDSWSLKQFMPWHHGIPKGWSLQCARWGWVWAKHDPYPFSILYSCNDLGIIRNSVWQVRSRKQSPKTVPNLQANTEFSFPKHWINTRTGDAGREAQVIWW